MGLTTAQCDYVIELLQDGKPLPPEFRYLLFPLERQEYELTYAAKQREEDILAETMAVPLQPIKAFGVDPDGRWGNSLVFGDNLQATKTMLQWKAEGRLVNSDGSKGVRLVYIDPPFATKREFRASQNQQAYQDKVVGAAFLEFVRRRLIILRELMSETGSLFFHCDYRKGHYIKCVLDEVFGEANFRNEIVLPGRASKNLQQQFSSVSRLNVRHDTLFWYTRSPETRFRPLWIEKHDKGNPEGHWHHFWSTADRRTMRYELFGITPTTGQWTWSERRAKRAVANYSRYLEEGGGRTLAEYWRDTGRRLDFIKQDPDDGKPLYWRPPARSRLADTMWSGVPIYANLTGYPTEKNEALLRELIELASSKGDIVLDAFAGSGTTLAVAEKTDRRWIGIDCGKLAIYTIQKRMLSLRRGIGNRGKQMDPACFTVYNAGLYDFARLKRLAWHDWRFFALHLFQCDDEPHSIGGIHFDGYRRGDDVLVFRHLDHGGVVLDYGFVDDLHEQIGSKVSGNVFIIAPAASVLFLEDYLDRGHTRYYILRIPYSIVNELHSRTFEAITQPADEAQVNETVEAVGFDFIRLPEVACRYLLQCPPGQMIAEAVVQIDTFKSRAMAKGASQKGNREALSMVMVDYDYGGDTFAVDAVFYASDIERNDWQVRLPTESLGDQVMIVYIDIYGNEYKEVKRASDFGCPAPATWGEATGA